MTLDHGTQVRILASRPLNTHIILPYLLHRDISLDLKR